MCLDAGSTPAGSTKEGVSKGHPLFFIHRGVDIKIEVYNLLYIGYGKTCI